MQVALKFRCERASTTQATWVLHYPRMCILALTSWWGCFKSHLPCYNTKLTRKISSPRSLCYTRRCRHDSCVIIPIRIFLKLLKVCKEVKCMFIKHHWKTCSCKTYLVLDQLTTQRSKCHLCNTLVAQSSPSFSSSNGICSFSIARMELVPFNSITPTSVMFLGTSKNFNGASIPFTLSSGVKMSFLSSTMMRLDLGFLWRTTFHHGYLGFSK